MASGNNPGVAVLMNVVPRALFPEPVIDGVLLRGTPQPVVLRAVWVGDGFPADVRRALAGLTGPGDEATAVAVTARRMSPGSIRLLDERELSWADADGYANITIPPGVFISSQKPQQLPRRATTGIGWSPTTEAVAEFILSRQVQRRSKDPRGRIDRIARIADATNISQGQVAKVLVAFDEEHYTTKSGAERGSNSVREFREQGRLLSDWAGHYARSARKERRADLHMASRDPRDWMKRVRQSFGGLPWASSGWAGAEAIAPFATSVPDMILYVSEGEFDKALERMIDAGATPVDRGGRVHLRSARDYVFGFARGSEHDPIASPVRVYADLLRVGNRGAEAAEHVRQVAIGF